eukprot:312422_1
MDQNVFKKLLFYILKYCYEKRMFPDLDAMYCFHLYYDIEMPKMWEDKYPDDDITDDELSSSDDKYDAPYDDPNDGISDWRFAAVRDSHQINEFEKEDQYYSTTMDVAQDLLHCISIQRLTNNIQEYQSTQALLTRIHETDIALNLNDFIHLLHNHDKEEDMMFIVGKFLRCDINTCHMFKRNSRNRQQSKMNNNERYKLYKTNNTNDISRYQIMDKIHCHYMHRYGTANDDHDDVKHDDMAGVSLRSNKYNQFEVQ